jgi:hypothetical protein
MDVKKEMTNARMIGIAGKTSTPETGKCMIYTSQIESPRLKPQGAWHRADLK